jgi:hypothetical protein
VLPNSRRFQDFRCAVHVTRPFKNIGRRVFPASQILNENNK